jgi:AcrR family transcriptional regulator
MNAAHEPNPRERLLEAAERVVISRGVAGLTFDAVAREAGVSKGGLLHYFVSKEALLNAMLQRMADFIGQSHARVLESIPPGPGRVAKAVLAWAFGHEELSLNEQRYERLAAVFLSAFHYDPALLDPMRAFSAQLKASLIADGLSEGDALVLLTACDGIFMAHMFKTYVLSPADMAAMRATLYRLAGVCA